MVWFASFATDSLRAITVRDYVRKGWALMLGDAHITFTGNVSQAPELRFTPAGQAVCNFSVAVQGRRKVDGGYEDGETSFYRCTVWRDFAEHVAESLSTGDRVFVAGDLALRPFVRKDESKGTSVEVDVSECGPSLRFAVATPTKARHGAPEPARDALPV